MHRSRGQSLTGAASPTYAVVAWMLALALCGLGLAACESGGSSDDEGGGQADLGGETPGEDAAVVAAVVGVELRAEDGVGAPEEGALTAGEARQLRLIALDEAGGRLDVTDVATWLSSDAEIATVSAGLVLGVGGGEVTITARHAGFESSGSLSVVPAAPATITIAPDGAVRPGEVANYRARLTLPDGSTQDVTDSVTWRSGNERILAFDAATPGRAQVGNGGPVTITVEGDGVEGALETVVRCVYPRYIDSVQTGRVLPPLNWKEARDKDGNVHHFSFADWMCFDQYRDETAMFIVVGAGWCPACKVRTRQIQRLWQRIEEAGGQVLHLTAQTASLGAASSAYSHDHISRLIENGHGIRVGDVETQIENEESPDFFLGFVRFFPSIYAVRRSDMVVVADQGESRYLMPFIGIAADPTANWRDFGPPPIVGSCQPGEEEAGHPANSFSSGATRIGPGVHSGGICDSDPDYYFVNIDGDWRAELDFDQNRGDLDMYLWNTTRNEPMTDDRGNVIGSDGPNAREVFSASGPGTIMITGFFGQTGAYTLTITER